MIANVEKLMWFEGKQYVDLRDYFCRQQMKRKKDIRVVHGNEYMDIPANKIFRSKKIITKEKIQSIYYPDQKYQLWSYEWKPNGKITEYLIN